jgi:nitrate reductase NapD
LKAEYNVCGVLVHAQPAELEAVRGRLAAMPGVEVHAASGEGKMVVTVEDAGERLAIDTVTEILNTAGVISASLVYQYTDDEDLPQESAP